jgi:hypothetical protein
VIWARIALGVFIFLVVFFITMVLTAFDPEGPESGWPLVLVTFRNIGILILLIGVVMLLLMGLYWLIGLAAG